MNLLDDPSQVGALSLGLRLLSTPGKFGQALGQAGLGAMSDVQQAKAAQDMKRQKALQEQMLMMQLEQIKAQQQRQQGIEGAYRGAIESPATQALAGGGGPTVANAQAMQGLTPRVNQSKLIEGLLGADPIAAYQMMQPKPRKLTSVAPGASLVDEATGESVFSAPVKEPSKPTAIQEYEYAKAQGYTGTLQQFKTDLARAGSTSIKIGADGKSVPPAVVKQQDELIDRMTIARSIEADLGAIEGRIDRGELTFGPVQNLVNQGRNMAGLSNEQSRNFATFKSTLEKLRNDSLRLNTGVQTEGDAQRAWNELFQNINDGGLVRQRLAEIRAINQRAAKLQQFRLDVLRQNFGAGALSEPPIAPALDAGGGVRRFNPETGKIE